MAGYNWIAWSDMKASDWAAWVQAVGAIAAIIGAFQIAQRQHAEERILDERRRIESARDRENADIFARTLAAKNMVQVATQAIDALDSVVKVARDPTLIYEIGDYRERLGQLRELIDGLITASTDHIAVVAALNLSRYMTQTISDTANTGGAMSEMLLQRCEKRALDATNFVANLYGLQARLISLCADREISLDARDFE